MWFQIMKLYKLVSEDDRPAVWMVPRAATASANNRSFVATSTSLLHEHVQAVVELLVEQLEERFVLPKSQLIALYLNASFRPAKLVQAKFLTLSQQESMRLHVMNALRAASGEEVIGRAEAAVQAAGTSVSYEVTSASTLDDFLDHALFE